MKWSTSMMLLEHNEMLKQLNLEMEKMKRPKNDEQQIEEMAFTILSAEQGKHLLNISYFENGFISSLTGFVSTSKHIDRQILIKTNDGFIKAVSVDNLINVEFADGEKFYD
ncbi:MULTISPECIES: YolD-like family protein [Bacillus]|uniref:YolD-like family protein n=1 Tax=Bacillus TaxID=1386 RepID=UPI001ABE5182|nr:MULTISPECIES: YolD-like family protein [Bacillus]MBR7817941.1 YolD-like family protein [Bacillus sp. CCNWLCWHY013]MDJ0480000.1 YolD-like family protein [Bacillus amyloliquefaciens]QTG87495.1 YolD-like family protein [Bacillus amyloliquefaciens]